MNIVLRQLSIDTLLTIYVLNNYNSVIIICGGSSENKIGNVKIVMNKILRVILGVRRNNLNVPLMNTDEMYARLNIKKKSYFFIFLSKIL